MKKTILSLISLLTISFFLSGLQGNLYFFPIALPYFWFIIFTYYSFKKSLTFSLIANIGHVLVLSSFTTMPLSFLILLLNFFSFTFTTIEERFHTSQYHIAGACGGGCFLFLAINWLVQSFTYQFYYPNLWSWIGVSLMTLLFAPPLILILNFIDQKIHFERIDTLENLRI